MYPSHMMRLLVFLLTISSASSSEVSTEVVEDHQVRLLKHILDRPLHERIARPVRNGVGSVNVSIRMSLYQIIDVVRHSN